MARHEPNGPAAPDPCEAGTNLLAVRAAILELRQSLAQCLTLMRDIDLVLARRTLPNCDKASRPRP